MDLRKSAEDYLEAILVLKNQKGAVRSIDVARHMQFSKPSVSRAVANLRRDGYLAVLEDGELELTEQGRQVAEDIYERHTVLTNLFTSLGVQADTAADDACRVEHVISEETFRQIKKMYNASAKAVADAGVAPADETTAGADKPGKEDKKKKKKKKKS